MKSVAGALLLAAAAVFVVCLLVGDGHGAWGYLLAGSEAAMVGGLADWFAVTALFRHPLRIPIPHTAIIPRKKDQIGASLGEFVQRYLITGDVVSERIAAANVPGKVGTWLADPAHASRVAGDFTAALSAGAEWLDEDELRTAIADFAEARLEEVQAAPVLARLVEVAVEGGHHQVALTSALRSLGNYLDENRVSLRGRLSEESPTWVPEWVDDKVFKRLFSGFRQFIDEVAADPEHELRESFDIKLRAYAYALRNDPVAAARAEEIKAQILEHPALRAWTTSLWSGVRQAFDRAADDPSKAMQSAVASVVMRIGTSLRDDDVLGQRLTGWLQKAALRLFGRYGDDLGRLIASTVERWDANETGRRLELQVGRDLQFIRINGTVVGAVVGLLLHAVAQLLG